MAQIWGSVVPPFPTLLQAAILPHTSFGQGKGEEIPGSPWSSLFPQGIIPSTALEESWSLPWRVGAVWGLFVLPAPALLDQHRESGIFQLFQTLICVSSQEFARKMEWQHSLALPPFEGSGNAAPGPAGSGSGMVPEGQEGIWAAFGWGFCASLMQGIFGEHQSPTGAPSPVLGNVSVTALGGFLWFLCRAAVTDPQSS